MRLDGPHRYRLLIDPGGATYRHDPATARIQFSAPATSRSPKLYVISVGGTPIYVGQTVQSVSARLRLGFTADGSTGYHGYSWRHQHAAVDLDIWILAEAPEDRELLDLETIEAELVYLVRHHLGQWPGFQTEIHFHASSEEHRKLAAQVYSHYFPDAPPNATNVA